MSGLGSMVTEFGIWPILGIGLEGGRINFACAFIADREIPASIPELRARVHGNDGSEIMSGLTSFALSAPAVVGQLVQIDFQFRVGSFSPGRQ